MDAADDRSPVDQGQIIAPILGKAAFETEGAVTAEGGLEPTANPLAKQLERLEAVHADRGGERVHGGMAASRLPVEDPL